MSNKYPNIKEAKISHAEIARFFGFKTVKSFDRTSAHGRYMRGVERILIKIKLNYDLMKVNKSFSDEVINDTISFANNDKSLPTAIATRIKFLNK